MVKKIFSLLIISSFLYSNNIFETNCIPCHKNLPTNLQQMFMQYLKLYSSEKNVKYVLIYYLKHPSKELSSMSDLFIDVYGIKKPTKLSNQELKKAIDIYWNKYKIIDNLK